MITCRSYLHSAFRRNSNMTSVFNQLPFQAVLFLSINIQVLSVNADTIAPGDTTARNHLQYLSDSGTINVPLTTWPITSEEIAGALEQIRPDLLNPANASSYRYLQSIVNAKSTLKLEVYSGTSRDALSAFSSSTREENEARASIDLQNNRTSGTLSISIVDVPLDGKHIRLDGTLVSARIGNWDLGAGWADRWWVPGWQSSLIPFLQCQTESWRVHPTCNLRAILCSNPQSDWSVEIRSVRQPTRKQSIHSSRQVAGRPFFLQTNFSSKNRSLPHCSMGRRRTTPVTCNPS
ncbi:MAG: hypothetical protein ACI92G_000576 [Candidatus Pelagisphaera sp.]|jgi:hypothetical protein